MGFQAPTDSEYSILVKKRLQRNETMAKRERSPIAEKVVFFRPRFLLYMSHDESLCLREAHFTGSSAGKVSKCQYSPDCRQKAPPLAEDGPHERGRKGVHLSCGNDM